MSERIFLDDWKPHLWKEVEHLRGEAEERFSSYSQGLEIPRFELNENKTYQRLLFHFSPESKVKQRGKGNLIPESPLLSDDFIPTKQGYEEWEKTPKWVHKLPYLVTEPQNFFFLDEPFPKGWAKYPWYFEFCVAYIKKGQQEPLHVFALLTNGNDQPYVIDREPMAIYQFYHKALMWEGVSAYAESVIQLEDYQGEYVLPEVIIPHSIASSRLIHIGQVDVPDVPLEFRPKPKPIVFTVTGEVS